MKQIALITHTFINEHFASELFFLWDVVCVVGEGRIQPCEEIIYDNETAFFLALEYLLVHNYCRLITNDGNKEINKALAKMDAKQACQLLKDVWIGEEAINKLDEENQYVDWWFVVLCPYNIVHRCTDESGEEQWVLN